MSNIFVRNFSAARKQRADLAADDQAPARREGWRRSAGISSSAHERVGVLGCVAMTIRIA